jgi:hypothetical protein
MRRLFRTWLHPEYPPYVELWLRAGRRSFTAIAGDNTDYGIMLGLIISRNGRI